MGGCVSKKTHNNNAIIRASVSDDHRLITKKPKTQSRDNYSDSLEPVHKDYEEYEKEVSGEGIKRIKAYKCSLLINELHALRLEFWNSKKENKRHWQIIQRACETDAGTAEIILTHAGLVSLDGNMKCVVDTASGFVFNIPNFCINDPLFKKELLIDEQILEKTLNNSAKYEIAISNKKNGNDLKEIFYKKENVTPEEYKIRLLYKGHEIKDNHHLSIYNFDIHPQVQVSCNKIEYNDNSNSN